MALTQNWQCLVREKMKPTYDAFMKFYPFTLENLDGEEWRQVPDFEDYQVSNYGRAKSFKNGKSKILRPLLSRDYLLFAFSKNGKIKRFLAHRLVAQLFIPNLNDLPQVDHVNGDKLNCCAANLRWVSSAENQRSAVRLGLIKSGENNYLAKLTNEQAKYIRGNPDKLSIRNLAELFGVGKTTISVIQRGKKYKAAGGVARDTITQRIPDEIRQRICSEYKKGVCGCGYRALAQKYNISRKTVFSITREM